ncbi:MAG: ComEA family DNA-binding protein [Leptothrix sp. (in: b-proteobacteria)]
MWKQLIAALCLFGASALWAAVDINKATQADLEAVKGIGPAMSGKILDERKKSPFKDWLDVIDRVKGIGPGNAAKFSEAGLTVNGGGFGAAAATAKADKPVADKK